MSELTKALTENTDEVLALMIIAAVLAMALFRIPVPDDIMTFAAIVVGWAFRGIQKAQG